MAEPGPALLRLAARLGLAPDYHDIWGGRHAASAEALTALVGAFGIEAGSEEAAGAGERALEAAGRRDALPPVLAIEANAERWTVTVRVLRHAQDERGLSAQEGSDPTPHPVRAEPVEAPPPNLDRIAWTLEDEGGARRRGESPCVLGDGATAQVEIALPLPPGYHRLRIDGLPGETLVIAAPATCWRPPALQDQGRVWGPALQLYALRSERNWGIGDFGDLATVIEQWSARGAGIVGLNPLHALFAHNPAHISPYSPSSRLHLNVLYIDVEAVEDLRDCAPAQALLRSPGFQQRLAQLRAAELVDYPGVAAAKFEMLRLLHAHFRAHALPADTPRARDFRAFCAERGETLARHAAFEALQAHFHAADPAVWGWPVWPEGWRDPDSEAVRGFVAAHAEAVEYHAWLQWLADRQLRGLSRLCRARGLAVGLYLDLAVSVDRAGSDTWGHADVYAVAASIGAPPDEINLNGQNWGLPPLRPDRLRARGHALFIETLREAMRHAGALRIDHVMALMRLFWIPPGQSAREGAYVHYPFDELLAIVALESQRNHCMVIGEDLGTVAPAVRDGMAASEMLSYRLLYFERGADGAFKRPEDYPREALVALSTHDLATLAGWWSGHDLAVRRALGLYPSDAVYEQQLAARPQERTLLLLALQHAGLLPEGMAVDAGGAAALTPALVEALHAYLATTPARVQMVQLEDALGLVDQANLPGTVDEHPNWRRKLPLSLGAIDAEPRVQALAARLAQLRPHAALRPAGVAPAEAVVPRATYRLQFHRGFGFDDAIRVLPYLQRLGISHVYGSPILRARSGSLHGYDVVAPGEINPELGGPAGFERWCAALRAHGMGQLLDVVPNHMGIGGDNAWWMDVLEHGEASAHARWFDIDWQPVNPDLRGRVLLPVLGDHYGDVLEGGQLQLAFEAEAGRFALRYWEHRYPLDPRSYATVLARAAAALDDAAARDALASLAAAFGHLPPRELDADAARAERARDQALLKQRLAQLAHERPEVRGAIEAACAALNAREGADALDALLELQPWRLAYWRVAADEINYRRFFDINDLAALRIEEPEVFEATQGYALELAAAGLVDGLRIDHPDGLHDPAQYVRRLQQGYARRAGLPLPDPGADGAPARPLYLVVEKIAAAHEDVPADWPVHGTTGYRYAMLAGGVQVDGTARERFDRIWRRHSGDARSFEELAYEGRRAIMRSTLASELTVLATELKRIARADRRTRDYSANALREALAEVAACMPVYRTYIAEAGASAQDLRYIDWAVAQARRRSHAADASVFDFVRASVLGRAREGAAPALEQRVLGFARRFQQFCAPVAAKGVEDTAYYRYARLVSLNEVGGDPGTFGITVRAFHGASADRAERRPHTMLATSTHDNKRSEDVRCRLNVLSEMPARWRLALSRWRGLARAQRAADAPLPAPADELLLYQTLLGTLPAGGLDEATLGPYRERIEAYVCKAAREAKRHTSWIAPDADYEQALLGSVRSVLARVRPNPLLGDIQALAERLAWFGALNSLAMVLLKCTSPGVPDLYQGNELIDLSLVDPDNRRPVDYALRARHLDALEAMAGDPGRRADGLATLLAQPHDGRLKLWCTLRLLQLRRALPALFRDGGYLPLAADGAQREHVLAYARRQGEDTVVVVCGRLYAKLMRRGGPGDAPLGAVWGDTTVALPPLPEGGMLDNVLTGETLRATGSALRLADVFARLPVAALRVNPPASGPR